MLLEFRLGNFRSFKDESAMSLIASADKSLRDNTMGRGISSLPRVVRSAVIYGPNASGKSNFLRGLMLMRGIVVESASLPPQSTFNIQPFRLDPETKDKPSLFEVTVSIDGVRYQYGFEATPNRIKAEWLLVYQSHKPSVWFDRRLDTDSGREEFKLGTGLKGSKQVWRDATRPNALFLSTAVQLNSEALTPLYRWFAEDLHVLLSGGQFLDLFTTEKIKDPIWERRIVNFLSSADIAISAIRAHEMDGFQAMLQINPSDGGVADHRVEKGRILRPRFTHRVGETTAEMEFEDESDGTQKLFAMAGPLFEILQRGQVLVIDELDRSLHELLVRHFVRLFHDPEINTKGAQLIFTSHDSSLLEGNLLRRDQVWFVEKGNDLASYLTPLTEYSARKEEALDRGYRAGRYGAIPVLPHRLSVETDLGSQ
jgi:AAA15 family ATPase/GTPase